MDFKEIIFSITVATLLIGCASKDKNDSATPTKLSPKYSGFSNAQRLISIPATDTTAVDHNSPVSISTTDITAVRHNRRVSIPNAATTTTPGTVAFEPYDSAPEPHGGYSQIQKNIVYPELARLQGIEGIVIVEAKIRRDGVIQEAKILQSIPILNEAAIAAIVNTHWKPAEQGGKPVTVWMSIPVVFRLKDH